MKDNNTQQASETYSEFLYMPPRAIAVTVSEAERRVNNQSKLVTGIPMIDLRLIPPVPGDLLTILARPGHAKTTTMIALSKSWASTVRTGLAPGKRPPVILYATWETLVEEFMLVYSAGESGQTLESIGRGTADLHKVKSALMRMMGTNSMVFGMSQETPHKRGSLANANLLPSLVDLDNAISDIKDHGFEVGAVFIDYLQRIPGVGNFRNDKTALVSDNLEMAKNLAKTQKVPVIMGVQSGRQVDQVGGLKFASMSDGQWTSNIEQTSDKVWTTTVPSKYIRPGDKLKLNGWEYEVSEQTLALKFLKQRFGPCTEKDAWLLSCDFPNATLGPHPALGEVFEDDEDEGRKTYLRKGSYEQAEF